MRISTHSCTLILAMFACLGPAKAEDVTPGRELAEQIFDSIEGNPSGQADMGEFVEFGRDIFVSMDYDESGRVGFSEFTDWDFGFNFIAEDSSQEHAYLAAQRILFAFWDQNSDGEISRREYHNAMVRDFRRADIDGNAFLTRDEFLQGYIVNVAYRAAIVGL